MRSHHAPTLAAICVSTLAAFAALPAASHHSVRDAFDADQPIRITVEGWPALNGSHRADTRLIEFADGSRIEIPESRWMSIDDPRIGAGNVVIGPFGVRPNGAPLP
jgi:hypothetical protein